MTTNRISGMPIDAARALTRPSKTRVAIKTVGIPALSKVIVSWTLHDVQDPQSALAVTTTSQFSRNSLMNRGSTFVAVSTFRRMPNSCMP